MGRKSAGVTEDLIEGHALMVNNDGQLTRCGRKSRSVIDLTLSTPGVAILRAWEIDEDHATPSDHAVIVFSWEPAYTQLDDREKGAMTSWHIDKLRAKDGRLKQA